MDIKILFRRGVSALFIAAILLINAVTHAEVFTAEGTYVMSEFETLYIAKERAKAVALRSAAEQARRYVTSYAAGNNFNLDSDSAELIAVNVIKSAAEPKFKVKNMTIRVTVKAQIDDSDIAPWLYRNLHENIIQYKALRRGEDKQAKSIDDLKRQPADTPQDKEQLAPKFAEADKIFLSHQKLHDALKLYNKGDFDGTIRLCDEAIALNPQYNFSYNNRALALIGLEQYEQAIKDFDTSIRLNPSCFNAYNNRGAVYRRLNQYEKALDDHTNAIKIKPDFDDLYFNRGVDYYCLGEYERAIADFDKALELKPNCTQAEEYRERCLRALGKL